MNFCSYAYTSWVLEHFISCWFFLKDSVLCSPGWSQIPCSWRWPELLTLLISLLQCWVYGYEPLFLTCAQVHMCSIQTFFWALKQGVLHTNYIAIAWMNLLSVLYFYGRSFHVTTSVCIKEMACLLHTSNGLPLKCEKVVCELSLWIAAIAITRLVLLSVI